MPGRPRARARKIAAGLPVAPAGSKPSRRTDPLPKPEIDPLDAERTAWKKSEDPYLRALGDISDAYDDLNACLRHGLTEEQLVAWGAQNQENTDRLKRAYLLHKAKVAFLLRRKMLDNSRGQVPAMRAVSRKIDEKLGISHTHVASSKRLPAPSTADPDAEFKRQLADMSPEAKRKLAEALDDDDD